MALPKEKKIVKKDKVAAIKNIADLANDPVLVKKREFAAEFIRQHGLPKGLVQERQKP
ncbi:hypothetical protein HNQ91_001175 [Filimonas zeae]|nr:hypothetical protein [Filimonas zeae]MDR6338153.1 hypothetical protein [Filimonas zeae]